MPRPRNVSSKIHLVTIRNNRYSLCMTVIKKLPLRLLRHIAKHPNTTIDSSFVNPKPVNARVKKRAEQDLWEAIYYLWEPIQHRIHRLRQIDGISM